jgi:hypothetical protein
MCVREYKAIGIPKWQKAKGTCPRRIYFGSRDQVQPALPSLSVRIGFISIQRVPVSPQPTVAQSSEHRFSRSGYCDHPDGLSCSLAVYSTDLKAYVDVIRLGRVYDVTIPQFLVIDGNLFTHVAFRDS